MLVSHKKNADQTLSVKIHESQPVNQKKPFSQVSQGSKEWMSEGFEKYAKWSKAEFYPTNDCDDSSNEETNDGKDAMPEVILDDHGYAKLPSCKEVSLKGQQELAQQMHLTVKVPTGSMKPVPWLLIASEPLLYLDPAYLGTSILGIKTLNLVIEAINTARGGVTYMVKAKEGQHAAITEAGGEEHGTDTAAQTISTREEEVDC
ncbi:hypothetical protein BD769DRAFT_1664919 [Suillus cothurnatus]|nr:hypothetical protein BD769DRAFT_1664919 [Suillus cothurnatus]